MTHCSMPDHGKPAATSACCRPDSPSYMGANPMKELPWRGEALLATPVLSIRTADFWADAPTWRRAASNTFTCLVGCMVGDFGMMFYLGAFHPGVSLPVMMVLANGTAISDATEGLARRPMRIRPNGRVH